MQEEIVQKLSAAGIKNPRLEARMILEHTRDEHKIKTIVSKRIKGMPLDKAIGKKAFYKFEFYVNEHVLSPRPDTEVLVEKAISLIKDRKAQVLDLGLGSGCILFSIMHECPHTVGVGVDKSPEALEIARRNAKKLIKNYESKVTFIQSDWFSANFFTGNYWFLAHGFDMIVSNPPYIKKEDIAGLDKEVKDYDPLLALDGGRDGLRSYKRIAEFTPKILKKDGYLLLEVGIGQAEDVIGIFQKQGMELVEIIKDLAGVDRCIVLKKQAAVPQRC